MVRSIASFYADSHHGNAFGLKGPPYGPAGHRGDDTNGWSEGVEIPSLFAGVVTLNKRSKSLGWMITIQREDGRRFGYCHMKEQSTLAVGAEVLAGQAIGLLGQTGTAAAGAHVHVVCMPQGDDPTSSGVQDPRLFIVQARTAVAGGRLSFLRNSTPPTRKDADMELYGTTPPDKIPAKYLALNTGLVPGKPLYQLLPSGQMPRVTQDQNLASQWSQQQFGQSSSLGIVAAGWDWFDQLFDQAVSAVLRSGGIQPASTDISADDVAKVTRAVDNSLPEDFPTNVIQIDAEPAGLADDEGEPGLLG